MEKRNYDEVTATNEEMREDILRMLQEDDRKSIHVFMRGFVRTLTQDKDADGKISYVFDHMEEYTGETEKDSGVQKQTEAALQEVLAVVWNLIYDLEDLNTILDSCYKVAQTGFCAAEPGGTQVVTLDDLHGVFFMLSNTLFEKHAELAALVDAAHRIITTNKTLQEANQRRLAQKYD